MLPTSFFIMLRSVTPCSSRKRLESSLSKCNRIPTVTGCTPRRESHVELRPLLRKRTVWCNKGRSSENPCTENFIVAGVFPGRPAIHACLGEDGKRAEIALGSATVHLAQCPFLPATFEVIVGHPSSVSTQTRLPFVMRLLPFGQLPQVNRLLILVPKRGLRTRPSAPGAHDTIKG